MNAVLLALLIGALLLIQALIGGTRLVFSFPAYGLIALAAILSVVRRPVSRPQWLCLAGTLAMAGYVMARAAFSPVDHLWWADFYMVLACTAAYLLVSLHLPSPRLLGWLFAALLAAALAQVVMGFYQFSTGHDFLLFGLQRPPTGHRASGFFISPNHLAGYLEIMGMMALSFTCWSECRGWVRALLLYCAVTCLAGIALTGSRGGYLSVAFALVVFGFLSLSVIQAIDRRRAMLLGVAGTVALLLAIGWIVSIMGESVLLKGRMDALQSQFNGNRLDYRIYNWQAALDQWQLSPWLGTGAGTHLYFGRIFRRPPIQADPIHAHCDYLELLAEYGVAGAVLVAFFLAAHLRAGLRHLASAVENEVAPTGYLRSNQVAFYAGALDPVAAYLAHSVVDFNLHIPVNALVMAILLALLGGVRPATSPLAPAVSPDVGASVLRLVLPLLGGWLGVVIWTKLPAEYWTEKIRQALVARQYLDVLALQNKVVPVSRDPESYFYLGEANRLIGSSLTAHSIRGSHFQAALQWYGRALAIFPQDEMTWVRMGESYDALRKFPEAETAYLTALRLDPNLGMIYAYYAADLRLRGHPEQAELLLSKAHELSGLSLESVADQVLDAPREIDIKR